MMGLFINHKKDREVDFLKKAKVRFVDASAISRDEAVQYWDENRPLLIPWGLPDSDEWLTELRQQGLPLDRPYFVIVENEE